MRLLAPRALLGAALGVAAIAAGCNLLEVREPPALAPGTRECIGLPQQTCLGLVADRDESEPDRTVTAWRARCSVASCTPSDGTADVTLVWSDGTNEVFSAQWASAPLPAPETQGPAATIAQPT